MRKVITRKVPMREVLTRKVIPEKILKIRKRLPKNCTAAKWNSLPQALGDREHSSSERSKVKFS